MMKDKALEELFLTNRPTFDDKDEFMAQLTRKLDAVEYLRQYEEANLRRYKYAMIATFILGFLSCGVLLAFVLNTPLYEPLFTFDVASGFFLETQHYSRPVISICLMLFMGFSIIAIVSNILDIAKMMNPIHPSMVKKIEVK